MFLKLDKFKALFSLGRGVNISVLRHEAEFYGITPLGKRVKAVDFVHSLSLTILCSTAENIPKLLCTFLSRWLFEH